MRYFLSKKKNSLHTRVSTQQTKKTNQQAKSGREQVTSIEMIQQKKAELI